MSDTCRFILRGDQKERRFGILHDLNENCLRVYSWCCEYPVHETDDDTYDPDEAYYCALCRRTFREMPCRDSGSWAPMISAVTALRQPLIERWVRGWVGENVEVTIS